MDGLFARNALEEGEVGGGRDDWEEKDEKGGRGRREEWEDRGRVTDDWEGGSKDGEGGNEDSQDKEKVEFPSPEYRKSPVSVSSLAFSTALTEEDTHPEVDEGSLDLADDISSGEEVRATSEGRKGGDCPTPPCDSPTDRGRKRKSDELQDEEYSPHGTPLHPILLDEDTSPSPSQCPPSPPPSHYHPSPSPSHSPSPYFSPFPSPSSPATSHHDPRQIIILDDENESDEEDIIQKATAEIVKAIQYENDYLDLVDFFNSYLNQEIPRKSLTQKFPSLTLCFQKRFSSGIPLSCISHIQPLVPIYSGEYYDEESTPPELLPNFSQYMENMLTLNLNYQKEKVKLLNEIRNYNKLDNRKTNNNTSKKMKYSFYYSKHY